MNKTVIVNFGKLSEICDAMRSEFFTNKDLTLLEWANVKFICFSHNEYGTINLTSTIPLSLHSGEWWVSDVIYEISFDSEENYIKFILRFL